MDDSLLLSNIELKQKMLNMLDEFDSFCKTNHLRYYLGYGTLLGALRHNGFIPWDDDVDLIMPREDYDKLAKYNRISSKTKIVTRNNPQGCWHPYCYLNLIDEETNMISKNMGDKSGKGVFIDVFPLDKQPDNTIVRRIHKTYLSLLEKMLWLTFPSHQTNFLKKGIGKIINPNKLANHIELVALRYKDKNVHHLSNSIVINYKDEFGTIINFEPYRLCDFEGKKYRVPAKAEAVLEGSYGNWRLLPPESKRIPHHNTRFYWKESVISR